MGALLMNKLCPRLKVVCVACVCATLGVTTAGAWGQCVANELAKVTASDGDQGDHFGEAVSISGDVALVGVHNDVHEGVWSGSAYVYRYDSDTSAWVQEQKLVASDAEWGDEFGWAASISGDVALITSIALPGSVYVFRYDAQKSQWIEAQQLLVPDGLGSAVCVEGDVAIVGAAADDDAGQGSGAAYVFRVNEKTGLWDKQAKLTASDAEAFDKFGRAVSISTDVILIGAPGDENKIGSAYVFVKPVGGWADMTETAKLTASDGAIFDNFGMSVSLSGDVALIGAWLDDDAGSNSGSAYVFRFDPKLSDWIQEQKLAGSDLDEADGFGFAVSLSDNVALIGARGHDDGGLGSGSAYVFRFDGSNWIEQAKLLAADPAAIDEFGFAVAISADGLAAIGALNDDEACPGNPDCNSGSAYIFGGLSDCNNNGELDLCEIADGNVTDKNNNGIPDECETPPCPWDLNGDGTVGVGDLLALFAVWGPCPGLPCPGDLNGDGTVGVGDLLILFANWGPCPS